MKKYLILSILIFKLGAQTIDYNQAIKNLPEITDSYQGKTLAINCAAAAGKTVLLTKTWDINGTLSCNIRAVSGGILKPTTGHTTVLAKGFNFEGNLTLHLDTTSGGAITFNSSSPLIYPEWWGAKNDDSTDNAIPIKSCFTASAGNTGVCYFSTGVYRHSGLAFSFGLVVRGASQYLSILKYTGTGTGIALTTPSGSFSDIGIQSTQGYTLAATGISTSNATEFFLERIKVGGGPNSSFGTCISLTSSGIPITDSTTSFCPVQIKLATSSSASIGTRVRGHQFFECYTAGILADDVGEFTLIDSYTEACQNLFLVDNTDISVVASGSINIINNQALLLGSSNGHTYTNPQFININGNNASNTIVANTINISGNRVQSAAPDYCNTFSKTLSTGSGWRINSYNNNWAFGCSTSVFRGDNSFIIIQSKDEILPNGQAVFSGTLTGTYQDINGFSLYTGGTLHLYTPAQYNHSVAPVASSCGTSPAFGTNSSDRSGLIQIGTGTPTACTITFGTVFASQPYCSVHLAFNATGTATLTNAYGSASIIKLEGTNMQGSSFIWNCPYGN